MGVMGEQLSYWGVVEEQVWRKGPWTSEEDKLLIEYVNLHGEGRWNSVARLTELKRNGKSCRLRWVNYLRPDLKRSQITPNEESIIIELHARWGNRWSTIARSLPGRTDNEIKNYWRTHFKKKAKPSLDMDGKSKVSLLRKQQFREQQLQHQQQIIQANMKKTVPLVLVENETKSMPFVPQMRQEVATPYANIIEDQSFSSHLFNDYYGAYINEIPNEANNFCDSLWNLDDFHRNLGVACGANKGGLMNPNLVSPFY